MSNVADTDNGLVWVEAKAHVMGWTVGEQRQVDPSDPGIRELAVAGLISPIDEVGVAELPASRETLPGRDCGCGR